MNSRDANRLTSTVVIPFLGDSTHVANLVNIVATLESQVEYLVVFDDRDNDSSRRNLSNLKNHIPPKNLIVGRFGSAGAARNAALPNIKTKWFSFCDSDDYLYISNYLEVLGDLEYGETNICVSSYEIVSYEDDLTVNVFDPGRRHNQNLIEMGKNPGLWRCIFLTSKFISIRFPELSMGEDQSYLSSIFQNSHSIKFTRKVTYRYSKTSPSSLTSTKDRLSDLEESIRICQSNIRKGKFSGFQAVMVVRQCFTLIQYGSFYLKFRGLRHLIRFIIKKNAINPTRKLYFVVRAII